MGGDLIKLNFSKNKISNLSEEKFIKEKFKRVDEIEENEVSIMFGELFSVIALMVGIKNKIDPVNKLDIKNMILKKYKSLSIEDIWKAFELERYGEYENHTEHFQLFGAIYVSSVLKKFKKWKEEKRKHYGMTCKKDDILLLEENKEDIDEIMESGIERIKIEYIENGEISVANDHIYDYLVEVKKIVIKDEYKREVYNKSKQIAINEANDFNNRLNSRKIIKSIKEDKYNRLISISKKIILEDLIKNKII